VTRRLVRTSLPAALGREADEPLEDLEFLSDEVHVGHGELIAEFEAVMESYCGWDGKTWGQDMRLTILPTFAAVSRPQLRLYETAAADLAALLSYCVRPARGKQARAMARGLIDLGGQALAERIEALRTGGELPLLPIEMCGVELQDVIALLAGLIDPVCDVDEDDEVEVDDAGWGRRLYAEVCFLLDHAASHALFSTRLPPFPKDD